MAVEKLAYSINEAMEAKSISRFTLYSHIARGRVKANRVAVEP